MMVAGRLAGTRKRAATRQASELTSTTPTPCTRPAHPARAMIDRRTVATLAMALALAMKLVSAALSSDEPHNSQVDASLPPTNSSDHLKEISAHDVAAKILEQGDEILPASAIASLLGQVTKTMVYGGANVARFNSGLLCALLAQENLGPQQDIEEEPMLYAFNDHTDRQRAYRIYADDELTDSIMAEAGFDSSQMTFIFVHGWLGGVQNEMWLSEAKDAALASGSRGRSTFRPNVIVADWSRSAAGNLYAATKNSGRVARRLGRLLAGLVRRGLRFELMHCLGHSIGAHICGRAARHARKLLTRHEPARPARNATGARAAADETSYEAEMMVSSSSSSSVDAAHLESSQEADWLALNRMGRITALDPGGFCYELGAQNAHSYVGLRTTDALLVDAYYTNRSPFGNKFQVAAFNVRVNGGFFQRPCSVWRNSSLAGDYLKAAVRFAGGEVGHNELLTCDHYFATQFAALSRESKGASCSFVGYACDSYRDFMRGRCGSCSAPGSCYTMDAEYQRPRALAHGIGASIGHALAHMGAHSPANGHHNRLWPSPAAVAAAASSDRSGARPPPDGVPHDQRRVYYMHTRNERPYCVDVYRVRVKLDPRLADVRSFKSHWLRVRLHAANGTHASSTIAAAEPNPAKQDEGALAVRELGALLGPRAKPARTFGLHGPWTREPSDRHVNGVDELTFTALVELLEPLDSIQAPLSVVMIYDNQLNRRQWHLTNPVASVHLDYLSASDAGLRARRSQELASEQFQILYRHLEAPAHSN